MLLWGVLRHSSKVPRLFAVPTIDRLAIDVFIGFQRVKPAARTIVTHVAKLFPVFIQIFQRGRPLLRLWQLLRVALVDSLHLV